MKTQKVYVWSWREQRLGLAGYVRVYKDAEVKQEGNILTETLGREPGDIKTG